jgi:hypothetical protein
MVTCSEVGKAQRRKTEQGRKLIRVSRHSIRNLNFDVKFGRASFGETLRQHGLAYFAAEFL